MQSYIDGASVTNRANSALWRIARVCDDHSLPSNVRLALIAKIMLGEPILECESPAAGLVRRAADAVRAYH